MDFSALENHVDQQAPGTPEVALLRREAQGLLRRLDAQEKLQTQKVWPLKSGMWNALYRLEPAGLVAKLSAYLNRFEVDFLQAAKEQQVKVPAVVSAGTLQYPGLPGASYFLMEFIPKSINPYDLLITGKLETPVRLKLAEALGRELARLHRRHLGYISRFAEPVPSMKEALTHPIFSPSWDEIVPNSLFEGQLLKDFERVLHQSGYLEFNDGSLCHGDLNMNNILVRADTLELTAIIDPGGYAGMPMFDLAYTALPWETGFDFMERLVEVYQAEGGKFDRLYFNLSLLVLAYQHRRFHTPVVKASIINDLLPQIS